MARESCEGSVRMGSLGNVESRTATYSTLGNLKKGQC